MQRERVVHPRVLDLLLLEVHVQRELVLGGGAVPVQLHGDRLGPLAVVSGSHHVPQCPRNSRCARGTDDQSKPSRGTVAPGEGRGGATQPNPMSDPPGLLGVVALHLACAALAPVVAAVRACGWAALAPVGCVAGLLRGPNVSHAAAPVDREGRRTDLQKRRCGGGGARR